MLWDLRDADRKTQRLRSNSLKKTGVIGDYFVRASDSKPGCLGLIVKTGKKKCQAFLIHQSEDWTTFQLQGSPRRFSNLVELLHYHSQHVELPVPIILSPIPLDSESEPSSVQVSQAASLGPSLVNGWDPSQTSFAFPAFPMLASPPHMAAAMQRPSLVPSLGGYSLEQLEQDGRPDAKAAVTVRCGVHATRNTHVRACVFRHTTI
jgi:hypothetical protein